MPANGHTSGVSVLGSDEERAEKRQPGRRFRRGRSKLKPDLLTCGFATWQSRPNGSETDCVQQLTGISFGKRLRGSGSVLIGRFATCFVCAACRFACPLARDIRKNT